MHRSVSSGRGTRAVVSVSVLLLSTGLLIAQGDRGTITGTLTDPSGAVIVGATVTAHNTGTGVDTKTATSSSGVFTIPFLKTGTYDVIAEQSGFKKYVSAGIVLQVGAVVRTDITMQLGAATESVNVTGQADVIQRDTSGRGNVVLGRDIQELPIVSTGEARNPGYMMALVPGVTGRGSSQGTPSGQGRRGDTTVNGSQAGSTEWMLDGAVIGQSGRQASDFQLLIFPPDVVGEFNVMTLNPPAEYGASGLGITAFSLKSGANSFHVSAWEYLRNCSSTPGAKENPNFCLDARGHGFAGQDRPPINKQNEFGVMGSGPIIKDKLFAMGWYSGFRLAKEGGSNAADTLPTAAMKNGDLSNLMLGQINSCYPGTTNTNHGQRACAPNETPVELEDALGRPLIAGAVYDPDSTRLVTSGQLDPGIPGNPLYPSTGAIATSTTLIRDPFPNNVIDPSRIDPVAAAMFDQFADPSSCPTCLAGYQNNWNTSYRVGTASNQYGTKIDYNVNDAHRLMGEFVWYRNRPVSGSKWPGAISEGSIQTIDQNFARFAHDYIIRANVVNHWTLGFDRNFNDAFPAAGLDWPSRLGYAGVPQTGAGSTFPQLIIGGLGNTYARGNQSYTAQNNYTFADTLSWTKGSHTIKAGFSYSQLRVNSLGTDRQSSSLNFNSGTTSQPGAAYTDTNGLDSPFTGMGVAGFLLGLPSNGAQKITAAMVEDVSSRYAGFVQDDWKVTSKLTLNVGFRYDLFRPVVNKRNQVSWFDPQVVNPDIGIPGALVFASPSRRNPAEAGMRNFGPRLGLAYSLNDKTVLRMGYGLMYTPGGAYRSIGGGIQEGFSSTNVLVSDQSQNVNGAPLLGFLSATATGQQNYHMTLGHGPEPGWPAGVFPTLPSVDPSFDNGKGPQSYGAWPGGGDSPYIQNWSFNIQRQLAGDVVLDFAYVGTKGTHLTSRLMNTNAVPSSYITGGNYLYPIFTNGVQTDTGNYITSPITDPAVQALPIVQAMPLINGIHQPFAGFTSLWGGGATLGQALRPFPQYGTDSIQPSEGGQMEDNAEQVGVSTYHALQVQGRKRFSQGLTFLASYTWSKTLTNAENLFAEFSGFTSDFYDARGEKALSLNDYPHNLVISYQYELPFGRGKKFVNGGGVADKILGGWIVAGVQQYQTGAPQMISGAGNPCGSYCGERPFISRPNLVPGIQRASDARLSGDFDPAIDKLYNPAAWTSPAKWTFGGAPRTDGAVRAFAYHNEDISIIKRTSVTERVSIEFRADFLNMFNRTLYGGDTRGDQYGQTLTGNNWGFGAGGFGLVTAQSNIPREIQFGLKINY